jgi:uncharacterized membrane protein YecN with MAPEG domain
MLGITALYAGVLGVMSIALAWLAGRRRGKTNISVGDGGDRQLLLAMRRHANFLEYVPLTLILLGLLEINGVPPTAVHVLGAGLVVSRISHAIGLKSETMQNMGRLVGAAGSLLVMLVASIWSIITFF